MMQLVNRPSFHYDKEYDSLSLFIDYSDNTYSEEVENNIYVVKDRSDKRIISVEILYFMSRSIENIKRVLPDNIFNMIIGIKNDIK